MPIAPEVAKQMDKDYKAGKTSVNLNFAILSDALSAFRADYHVRYIAAFSSRLDRLKAALATVNGDINKSHPYPSSQQSRKSYVQAKNQYDWAHRVTEKMELGHAPGDEQVNYGNGLVWVRHESYHVGAPHYVQIKQAAYDSAKAEAIKAADLAIDSYIYKLVGKIGNDIAHAGYSGYLWDGSVLTVKCADGEVQTWNTKCILNVSCLGTVFNQWPTRRAS